MCGLCGMFSVGEHWTDAAITDGHRRAERQHRLLVTNAILSGFGLRCAEWGGRMTLTGRTGKAAVVDNLAALWPAAERIAGRPLDPLDPALLDRLERR